ncbi:MAG: nucleotidyltransferase family protein [Microcoleaceae cyanobacterium]
MTPTTPEPTNDPYNPHLLSQLQTELVWEGKYDEYGNHYEVEDITDCVMQTDKIYQRLNTTVEEIIAFCERWNLAEFALFGSILRDDFRINGADPSDIDILFSYGFGANKSLLRRARMKIELEELLGRDVDVVMKAEVLNSHNSIRKKHILDSARIIYVKR